MHPQRVTVSWRFWYGGIIGTFFFKNEQGNEFFYPKIAEDDTDDIWFQQDRATCHRANVKIDLLRTVFENPIIRRYSDYFLWGAVKEKCYADHLETIETLRHEIKVAKFPSKFKRKQPMAENREKCPKLLHWVFSCFSLKNRFGCGLKRYMSII